MWKRGITVGTQVCNTQYIFFYFLSFFIWTLKTLPKYLNPGIHTVFLLASSYGFLFWHVAVWRKMCSHDTGVDCSCLMIVTSSSQCSLTNVCDAASFAALVFNTPGWCLYAPPSDIVVLMKSVRNGDYSAKHLSDFSEKPPEYPSRLKWHPRQPCCQCLHQLEGSWISDSTRIHSRFVLTREETPQIEISKAFCWTRQK